jgi:hypothetical protein
MEYEFVLAQNRTGFAGKVLATRGENWVHVNILQGSPFAAGPSWVNLNHVLLVGDATTTVIRGRLIDNFKDKK